MISYRILLKSNTAFFRNDVTSSSYQETFNCPPLSTILGLIAASYGEYCHDFDFGYCFSYEFKCIDYELILQKISKTEHVRRYEEYAKNDRFDRNDILRGCFGTIPVKREVLFNCQLVLYISDKEIAKSFENPFYSLLFGRSEDLVKVVKKPEKIELYESNKSKIKFGNTIVPLGENINLPGKISRMNTIISDSYPRIVEKSGIFYIIDKTYIIDNPVESIKYDSDLDIGVFIYDRNKI